MKTLLSELVDFVYPPRCCVCRSAPYERGMRGICCSCLQQISFIESPFCTRCGRPYAHDEQFLHLCGDCLSGTRYFRRARAVGYYRGVLKELLHLFKYRLRQHLALSLGFIMTSRLSLLSEDLTYQIIMPVPLHPRRLRARGFNQALCLAASISSCLQTPLQRYNLRRIRCTRSQVGLSEPQRADNVRHAFSLRWPEAVAGKSILIIDDIYTSGSTVNECARVLTTAGARHVDVLTLARAA